MDFDFSPEQDALRDAARDLLARRWPADSMRAALDRGPATIPAELWREICDLGWVGIAAPEAAGGSGADAVTACILAEETGRALLPGPFLSALATATALSALTAPTADAGERERTGAGHDLGELLGSLAPGTRRATLTLDGTVTASAPATSAETPPAAPDTVTLDGTAPVAADAADADHVVVAALDAEGEILTLVTCTAETPERSALRRIDAQEVAALVFHGTPAAKIGGAGAVAAARDAYSVLVAADLLGTARAVLEMSTEYARQRVQFGRPIGSFQAVSHRLADVCVQVEIAQGLVYGAALALDEQRPDASALVSAAKAWASDTAVFAAESALQVHGGVGYTWEADVHLYLRRARANAVTAGDADHHRDRLAAHLERAWSG